MRWVGIGAASLVGIAAAGVGTLMLAFPVMPAAETRQVQGGEQALARGTYLAEHVAVCTDCHSQRDESTFSAPVKPGTIGGGGQHFGRAMGFPGELVSQNITPHKLKSWTDGEILRAMTAGVTPDGRALFPLMNYPAYAQLCREDLDALVTYVRHLAPVDNEPPKSELDFPVNLLVRTMPSERPRVEACPDRKDTAAYGKYLVNMAGCIDCHTQREGPELKLDLAFGGGASMTLANGQKLVSKNITPDASGIGTWSRETFISRFAMYRDRANLPKLEHDDFQTIMPWSQYAGMSDEDLGAIYDFLRTVKPVKTAEPVASR